MPIRVQPPKLYARLAIEHSWFDTKAAHVRAHLRELGDPDPARVVFIGDTVDDAAAAASVGARCVVYHSGRSALHARDHFAGSGAPLVGNLTEAVTTARELLAA